MEDEFIEKIKKKIKIRTILFSCLLIMAIGLLIFTIVYIKPFSSEVMSETDIYSCVTGFQTGIPIGLMLVSIFNLIKYIIALNNDEKLRQFYIKGNDERTKEI